MKIKGFKCIQCGSSDFEEEADSKLRCAYCYSLYAYEAEPPSPPKANVIIRKGAKVSFGKHAHVTIRGGLEIEDGAEVAFNGKVVLIEKGSDENIAKAKKKKKKDNHTKND